MKRCRKVLYGSGAGAPFPASERPGSPSPLSHRLLCELRPYASQVLQDAGFELGFNVQEVVLPVEEGGWGMSWWGEPSAEMGPDTLERRGEGRRVWP